MEKDRLILKETYEKIEKDQPRGEAVDCYILNAMNEFAKQEVDMALNIYVNKLLCTKEIKIEKPICSNTIAKSIIEFLKEHK